MLEIEGEIIDGLKCEQVFELSDASAERSAAGCAVKVGEESISEYLTSNITMLKWMVSEGYGDPRTLQRRAASMQNWLDAPSPKLMAADASATYHTTIEIPLEEITEVLGPSETHPRPFRDSFETSARTRRCPRVRGARRAAPPNPAAPPPLDPPSPL